MKKSDPDWLLASVLKVLDVVVKDNTSPGKQNSSGRPALAERYQQSRPGRADKAYLAELISQVAVVVQTLFLMKFVIYYYSENFN